MDPAVLIDRFPRVFHAAAAASWPAIQRHGLLSTADLLDLHAVPGADRSRLLRRPRPTTTTLRTRQGGVAVIRDQKPLKFIADKIDPDSTLPRFLEALSSRVFFAPTRQRLDSMLGACEYRGTEQVVLILDTAALVARHGDRIGLCRFNSGACTHLNHPTRGHRSWLPISAYHYDQVRKRYGGVGLAEVTVEGSVPDALDLTTSVEFVTI